MATKAKLTTSNSDPNTNDLSFEQAMSIIAKTPKHLVDAKMTEMKGKKGKVYTDIQEPKEGAKAKKKSPHGLL